MFGGGNGLSVADIAAVTDKNGDGNGWGGMNGGWWALIIILALFGGFGGNGWGNNGRGANNGVTVVEVPTPGYGGGNAMGWGFSDAAMQRGFDNQTVITKLDGLNAGVCSLGYDQLAQIMQTRFGLQQAINNDTVANMQNTNALSAQLASCCCENRQATADLKYTMATDTCALNTNIHQTGDAIINSQNQGFQMLNNTINERFNQLAMAQKDQQISELQNQLNRCDRDSALQGMASYVINQVRPTPVPSYDVPNPYTGCCGNNYSGCCNTCRS